MAVVAVAPCQCFSPGRKPDDVTGPDFFNRATLELNPAPTGNHDQRLPEWVGMPVGTSTRLKGDGRAAYSSGLVPLKRVRQVVPCR